MQNFHYHKFRTIFLLILIIFITTINASKASEYWSSAISLFSTPKYKNNFNNFDFVDLKSKQGGKLKIGVEGTFNSLNPFILKGISASGIDGYIYETLTVASNDEIGVKYGLIAESIRFSKTQHFIEFKLRKIAQFSDGTPITADDVLFTFDTLKKFGHPSYKIAFRDIKKLIKINSHHIRFYFKEKYSRELPLIIASLPVLPQHFFKKVDFNNSNFDGNQNNFPIGSGPYIIDSVQVGKSISYKKNNHYWGRKININKGLYNFDKITFDYYRDNNVLIEAFKAQKYDFRLENVARNWANAYNIDAVKNNQIIKTIFKNNHPPAIQAFILNLRKEKFQDINLRKAINLAFDFKWLNQHIFYNSYKKTYSYFENSTFSAKSSDKELFTELEENEKINNGNGFNRNRLLLAQDILKKAGYKIINKKLFAPNNQNEPISIEFLIDSPAFEMVIAPFVNNLKKLGIQAKVRFTEQNQYQNRVKNFNFDIIISVFGQASIPGEELFFYWHSSQKDIIGSRNLSGVSNAKIDKIIENINQTNNIKIITQLARELDKELISNYYCILQWHNDSQRVLYRNIFSIPKISPEYGINLDSWSIK